MNNEHRAAHPIKGNCCTCFLLPLFFNSLFLFTEVSSLRIMLKFHFWSPTHSYFSVYGKYLMNKNETLLVLFLNLSDCVLLLVNSTDRSWRQAKFSCVRDGVSGPQGPLSVLCWPVGDYSGGSASAGCSCPAETPGSI